MHRILDDQILAIEPLHGYQLLQMYCTMQDLLNDGDIILKFDHHCKHAATRAINFDMHQCYEGTIEVAINA